MFGAEDMHGREDISKQGFVWKPEERGRLEELNLREEGMLKRMLV
jgi:hypothetical protein